MPKESMNKPTFAFVSLGCPKNLVDSERMLGRLSQEGYALVPEAEGADVVIVNTCGFIEPARQESLGVIREMLALKQEGKVGAVIVAGCLAERKKEDLLNEVPEVDQIVGVFGREEITQVVNRCWPSAWSSAACFVRLRCGLNRTRPGCGLRHAIMLT